MEAALIVIAKAARAGMSKTRLTPPLTPQQAAEITDAALRDTIHAVLQVPVRRKVLCLRGPAPDWLPRRVEVVPQRGQCLATRLQAAFDDVGCPSFLIAMDTPQITAAHLRGALTKVAGSGSAIGLTPDGGYWGIGFAQPLAKAFEGVPMSSATTGRAQMARLRKLGAAPHQLPSLRDVDLYEDALAVAKLAPDLESSKKLRSFIPSERVLEDAL